MSETPGWFLQNGTALAVLVGFALVMILSAWAANRRPVDRPGPIVIAVSFYATFLSTNTFLGQAGFGYKVGVAWLLAGGVFIVCAFVAWFVVARPMIRDAHRVLGNVEDLDQITVPEYLRRKYGSPAIGYVSAGIVFFASLLYMLAVFKGIGHIFSRILHVSYEAAVLAVLVLVAAYTSWGMIRAILHTDVMQGVVMVAGVMALFLACVKRAEWGIHLTQVATRCCGRAKASTKKRIPRLLLWRGVGLRSASDSRSCRPKAATAMNSRVGRLGGHSHDARNLTFLFRSREATTHRVYLNEVDTQQG